MKAAWVICCFLALVDAQLVLRESTGRSKHATTITRDSNYLEKM